jgi:hypothetical protein
MYNSLPEIILLHLINLTFEEENWTTQSKCEGSKAMSINHQWSLGAFYLVRYKKPTIRRAVKLCVVRKQRIARKSKEKKKKDEPQNWSPKSKS